MPFLILRTGLAKGANWPITTSPVTIGRDRECDIPLPDSLVSRRHCEVVLRGQTVALEDLGSSNPTLVNGKPVRTSVLSIGDEVTIGRAVFEVAETAHPPGDARLASQLRTTVSLSEGQAVYLTDFPMGETGEGDAHRTFDLHQLFHHSRSFSRVTSVAELVSSLANVLLEHFEPLQFWLGLVQEDGGSFRFIVKETNGEPDPSGLPEDAVQQAIRSLRGFLVPERVTVDGKTAIQLTLVAPVHFGGQPVAALAVRSHSLHRIYDEGDLHFLVSLANVAAPFFGALEYRERLQYEVKRLRHARQKSLHLVGGSPGICEVRRTVEEVADTLHPVLIIGETGTGKEVVANLVHELSTRADAPFVAVNCAAIPHDLFESELFGHEKGAFTGAASRKIGLMEQSDGGTLFLDEIGELSAEHQAAILRPLETRTFRRVGGGEEVRSDFRIVAATNRDIHAEVDAGTFRRDLYHRLSGVEIRLAPLHQRREDIVALAEHFLEEARTHSKHPITGFDPDALELLRTHSWPGNARELKYCIETAVTFSKHDTITLADLRAAIPRHTTDAKPPTLAEAEQQLIESALDYCGGNVIEAAEILGIGKDTVYRRLARYKSNP
jgi:DNA-binding NtrC family response regulator